MSLNRGSKDGTDSPPKNKNTLPPPCVGGCGFYGQPETKNCCSKCYSTLYPNESSTSSSSTLPSSSSSTNTSIDNSMNNNNTSNAEITDASSIISSDIAINDQSNNNSPKKRKQKKKNRCFLCRKKVTLAGRFKCKCGYVFCSLHRYPDAHECDFDYQKMQKERVRKENKLIAPAKFEKI